METQTIRISERLTIAATVSGSGPTVVLIHGIPGSAAVWCRVARELASTHRVIVPDLIGFGASSRSEEVEELWADGQAEAVHRLLDSLGVESAHIVGHDFGGPVGAALLRKDPSRYRSLLLASSNVFGDTPIPFPLSGLLWPIAGGLWSRLLFSRVSLRAMVRNGMGRPKPRIDTRAYVGDRGQARSIRIIFSTALRELRRRYTPVEESFRSCTLPAKVLWGSRDPFFSTVQGERTAALFRNGSFELLEDAGHFLPEERSDAIVAAVRELVSQETARYSG